MSKETARELIEDILQEFPDKDRITLGRERLSELQEELKDDGYITVLALHPGDVEYAGYDPDIFTKEDLEAIADEMATTFINHWEVVLTNEIESLLESRKGEPILKITERK